MSMMQRTISPMIALGKKLGIDDKIFYPAAAFVSSAVAAFVALEAKPFHSLKSYRESLEIIEISAPILSATAITGIAARNHRHGLLGDIGATMPDTNRSEEINATISRIYDSNGNAAIGGALTGGMAYWYKTGFLRHLPDVTSYPVTASVMAGAVLGGLLLRSAQQTCGANLAARRLRSSVLARTDRPAPPSIENS